MPLQGRQGDTPSPSPPGLSHEHPHSTGMPPLHTSPAHDAAPPAASPPPANTSSPSRKCLSTGSFSALLSGSPATAPHCPPCGYGRRGGIRSLIPSMAPQCPWELEAAGAAAVRELALKESWLGPHAAPPHQAQGGGVRPGMAVVRSRWPRWAGSKGHLISVIF